MIVTYEQFIFEVANRMKEEVSQSTKITTCQTRKINGVLKRGICISKSDMMAAPTIYLEEFYDKYSKGRQMDEIVHEIMDLYHGIKDCPADLTRFIDDFDFVRKKIVYRVVNWEYNQELLSNVPHFRYLDLAVLFYVMVDTSVQTNASMLITNEHLTLWNTSLEEIDDLAEENSEKILGYSFCTMESILGDMINQDIPAEEILYVYSNKYRSYGASVILDLDKLGEIADILADDLYILPCSVHELILVRVSQALSTEEMVDMVRTINRESLLREEILSDSIYYYSREEKNLLVMS